MWIELRLISSVFILYMRRWIVIRSEVDWGSPRVVGGLKWIILDWDIHCNYWWARLLVMGHWRNLYSWHIKMTILSGMWSVISGTVSKSNLSFILKGCSLSREQVTCLVHGWNKPIQFYECNQSGSMIHSMSILCLDWGCDINVASIWWRKCKQAKSFCANFISSSWVSQAV